MLIPNKRWLIPCLLVAAPLIITTIIAIVLPPNPGAVMISVAGYTNFPGNTMRFAFLTVSNRTGGTIRWRSDWEDIEGRPYPVGRLMDFRQSHYNNFDPVLKNGDSFTLAVGEPMSPGGPLAPNTTNRWRFSMSYVPYTLKERWLDLTSRHHRVPVKVGPFLLVDVRKILNPTNNIIASSEWLVKQGDR